MKRDLLSPLWTQSEPPDLTPSEWERLLSQCRRARLLGRVAWLLDSRRWLEAVPEGPRVHLKNALRQVRRQRDEAQWEADCIRRALEHLQIPIVLLKGAAYVIADLAPARGRIFADVDILVGREHLRAVELALFASGWIPARLDPYDERYYRDWMHELPPMQHIERGSALDVHHTITPPTSRFAVDASLLLAAAVPVRGVPRLHVLAPADMVLHSAVHLMQDGDFTGGQRDLLDIADLLHDFGRDPTFWATLVGRARELHLGLPLNDVLSQIRRLATLHIPEGVEPELQALAPDHLRNRLMNALLTAALRPDHPDCDTAFSGLARWLLYVRSHWLRMPWHQIVPHLLRKGWMRLHSRYDAKDAQRRMHRLGL